MKLPKSVYQYSILSGRLRLIALCVVVVGFLFAPRSACATSDASLVQRIHVVGEFGYFEDCPFSEDSEDFIDFLSFGIELKLLRSVNDVAFIGNNLIFKINPQLFEDFDCNKHSKGNVNEDPYLPLPEPARPTQSNDEQCKTNCTILFFGLEESVAECPIPLQFKVPLIGVLKAATSGCHKCCEGSNSFVQQCLQLIVNAYNKKLGEIERAVSERGQLTHDVWQRSPWGKN